MRAVIYIRVSDKSQVDGYSLEDQQRACREYAQARGWTVLQVYADEGRSAYRDVRRPQFEALLEAARRRQFDAVIIYKFDRFARKTLLQLQRAAELERLGIDICSATEPVDRRTAAGRLSFGMMAVVAQFTSDTTGERVKDARMAAVRQGLWVGPVPVGYIKGDDKVLRPSTDAEAVKLAAQLYATGQHSYTTICQELNDAGWRIPNVKTGTRRLFTKFAVEEMLQNDVYLGMVHCGGQSYPGKHEPLIDQETWDKMREVQAQRAGGRSRPASNVVSTPTSSLFDLAYCPECGSRMWYQPPSGTRKRAYYLCSQRAQGGSCKSGMVQAEAIEAGMVPVMQGLALPTEWHAEIVRRAERLVAPAEAPLPMDTTAIQAELRSLRLEFADERIDEATYHQEKARLQDLLDSKKPRRLAAADVSQVAPLLWDLADLIEKGTPLERHRLFQAIFERIWVEPHKIRAVTPTASYEALIIAAQEVIRYGGPGGHPAHVLTHRIPYCIPGA